jgi:hypothetical protein
MPRSSCAGFKSDDGTTDPHATTETRRAGDIKGKARIKKTAPGRPDLLLQNKRRTEWI